MRESNLEELNRFGLQPLKPMGGSRRMPFGRLRSAVSAAALTATLHRPKGTPTAEET